MSEEEQKPWTFVREPERRPIVWTVKSDCPKCGGSGLHESAIQNVVVQNGGFESVFARVICECVEAQSK